MSDDDSPLIHERRTKLQAWRDAGDAFPNSFKRTHEAGPLHLNYAQLTEESLEAQGVTVHLAGRLMLKRIMGKASFATLQDGTGRMQVFLQREGVGEACYAAFKQWDLGDILGVVGVLFKTRMGELTIRVESIRLLVKSLRPLPEKFHGLTDQEQKYRQRYLDLITNDHSRQVFIQRSRIVQKVREFLVARDYLEVETPMMHPIPGGAAARPFVTHHNALDCDLYLRIAPELYLKRLVVGGMERVFEINRNFRNEGLSPRHNPEFTMIEFYAAYHDYRDLMDLTEALLRFVAQEVVGTTQISYGGRTLDLGLPFHRLTLAEALTQYHPEYTPERMANVEELRQELHRLGVKFAIGATVGSLQLALFEETTEALLFDPTFIVDYPAEVSPLARRSDTQPDITERFELFVVGRELANGFSELNDAEDQAARFQAQVRQKEAGDQEAMHYDADYIRALEYGLPPTAGEGIGIDRLVMLLTDSPSIRDVILFPQMRQEAS
ncbi:MAG: lysine--tRNA ligase [Ferrovum sp.]|nr:lysine--tRNA ligase [Ferrovum sp.]NDU87721.1 lysine--tRNA ligase [Ferrovum sp.]